MDASHLEVVGAAIKLKILGGELEQRQTMSDRKNFQHAAPMVAERTSSRQLPCRELHESRDEFCLSFTSVTTVVFGLVKSGRVCDLEIYKLSRGTDHEHSSFLATTYRYYHHYRKNRLSRRFETVQPRTHHLALMRLQPRNHLLERSALGLSDLNVLVFSNNGEAYLVSWQTYSVRLLHLTMGSFRI